MPACADITSSADDLVAIFNQTFAETDNTRLIKGGAEPVYLPAGVGSRYHQIIFTRDYFSSALHEVAHWCVAGKARRLQEDYGYWYAPDGRSAEQQQAFEVVEVKPQALEWIFHTACGVPFRVSADNLAAGLGASDAFKQAIQQQVLRYCTHGLPARANIFLTALTAFYGIAQPLACAHYPLDSL